MAHTHASCRADGVILIGPSIPPGALPIVDGCDADVHRVIAGTARLAYDGETWLVPGIPESEGDDRLDALIAYRARAHRALQRIYDEDGADG